MAKMKLEKYFLLNFKEFMIMLFVVSFLLHNFLSTVFVPLSVFFFIISMILPIYYLIAILYTIFYYVKQKK